MNYRVYTMLDQSGFYFDVDGRTFGPFESRHEAEREFVLEHERGAQRDAGQLSLGLEVAA